MVEKLPEEDVFELNLEDIPDDYEWGTLPIFT